jgi:hypothetical protein
MWNHLKGLARSWFFLTAGEQQAIGLLLLLLFLGVIGRWGYTRNYGPLSDRPAPPATPLIEVLRDE